MRGPLASLTPIARRAAVTGAPAAAPEDGRNYSVGVGWGDENFTVGMRGHLMNLAGSTFDDSGPQYLSAAVALEFRYSMIRMFGFSLAGILAPTRTLLVDSTDGQRSWGNGVRYGGSTAYMFHGVGFYADVYQEQIVFADGPAKGNSTRSGVTFGMAFHL
ncbi:MAG TPA: hypothetical protein VGM90_01720 [Kofleriaceae bacterium]|jgi:hypothetical protein